MRRTYRMIVGYSVIVIICAAVSTRIAASAAAAPGATSQGAAEARPFTFEDVRRRAAELARQPFDDRKDELPPGLRDLDYDAYRDIRFRPDQALWRDEGLPFQVQFFQRASFSFMASAYDKVVVNVVDGNQVAPVLYSSKLFDFGRTKPPANVSAALGFAGFRLHYPLHHNAYYDEIVVFLGASYFRVLGEKQNYGLSARGLAIDTGLATKEEFPRFREFWLEKPSKQATEMTLYALLDSPSVTGAYRFVVRPGKETVMVVKANVFMRTGVQKMGFAPLTSMFFRGEGTDRFLDDFRPEVHDSDGLLMATGHGEWIWRPLNNPTGVRTSSFRDTNPRGFGLLQRDRDFDHYQDLESFYERRPSVWIETIGDWGKGAVQLVEIPSDADWYDNIVSFWVPDEPAKAGKEWLYEYRMYFALDQPDLPPGGKTYATHVGRGGSGGVIEPNKRKFVIDFVDGDLKKLPPDAAVEAVVTASSGKIDDPVVHHNANIDGWRVFFELKPEGDGPVELRCFLKEGDDALTETWSYQWSPKPQAP